MRTSPRRVPREVLEGLVFDRKTCFRINSGLSLGCSYVITPLCQHSVQVTCRLCLGRNRTPAHTSLHSHHDQDMVSPNRANESVNPPPAGRNIMTKRAAKRKAKREGVNTSYESRKVGMSLQEQRRVCEMAFLKRWPKIIPKGLFVKCRRLFKRKAEKLTDDDARYEHDTARRKAVELLSRERVRGGLDTVKEGDEWGELAKTDKEQWLKNEVDEMGWIIERLEVKNTPFNEGSMATPHGKLAVWRDFLHSTLRLENNGGVPDKTIPWLHDLLSYPAYRKSKESDHAEMAWKLGVQQALNFLVACRRRDGVNGTFERTGEHRYHKVEVDEWCRDWDPEDFMEEEWAAVRGVGGGRFICNRLFNKVSC